MKAKISFLPFIFLFFLIVGVFLSFNQSYEKSLKAKYFYETTQYKKAYSLAKESFGLDIYNRMASTIMAQSKIALKCVDFIDEAKRYKLTIDKIANQEFISDADKAKIKMMCEIVIESYVKLAPSVVTDKKLIKQSKYYNDMFEKLLATVAK